VTIARVQRAIDAEGGQLFLLKGGTLLQHRLNATARTTKYVDGLIRGDMDAFLLALEDALAEPWGPLTLRRGKVEVVNVPTKIIKPRRFHIIIEFGGVTWRRIQFQVSPDEAGIGQDFGAIEPPPLNGFGLPDTDTLVGIAMCGHCRHQRLDRRGRQGLTRASRHVSPPSLCERICERNAVRRPRWRDMRRDVLDE
jgi:hypothetical protein